MTQEQQAVAQEIYADHDKQTLPLRQQLMAKRAELNSLYYAEKSDSSKAQSLYREIADIQAKLYSANADLRKKLSDKGIAGGGFGMYHRGGMNGCPGMNGGGMHGGHGMNGGYGGGHGGGRGMHGNGHW